MTKRQAAHLHVLLQGTVTVVNQSGLPDCTEEEIARRIQIIAESDRYLKAYANFRKEVAALLPGELYS